MRKLSLRSSSPPSDAHLDGEERRVVDLDADALDRRHQHVAFAVLAQDRGEELHERQAADRRAQVEPRSVGGDAHVDVAAVGRIPQVHRRGAALGEARGFAEAGKRLIGGAGA